jgi:hypothetical protein
MVKVAILHEGNAGKSNDNWLLQALTTELALENSETFNWNRVECYGMGGKSNFFKHQDPKYGNLLQLIEADQITKVLFVMDADCQQNDEKYGGYENTLTSWQTLVTDNLKIHAISDIYITCDPTTQTGYIESLLLSTLDDAKKVCIETFLQCSDFKAKENHKAILNQIYKTAYPEAPYDLKHTHFDELKQKLRVLFT